MNKTLIASLLIGLCLIGLCQLPLIAIEGTYRGNGFDPYLNKTYTTKVVIKKDASDVYQATWNEEEADRRYSFSGTGIRYKDQVSFIFKIGGDSSSQVVGVQMYTIKGNILEGPFVYLDKNLVGTEKLVKQ